jgi:hypothetical protein
MKKFKKILATCIVVPLLILTAIILSPFILGFIITRIIHWSMQESYL